MYIKKTVVIVLVFAMMTTLLPQMLLHASAETLSGDCGVNLRWNLNTNTGVLTITGSGNMSDYFADTVPWISGRFAIREIHLPEGLAKIGNYAFSFCNSLKTIRIPSSVTSIGTNAFWDCDRLESVLLQEGVIRIKNQAFFECDSLLSVTIPASVTSIGVEAFRDCRNLSDIIVSSDNPAYCSENGVLFDKEKTNLIQYPSGKGGQFKVPDGVLAIKDYSFSCCSSIRSVIIANSVTSIGDYAFYDCNSLTNIVIPDSVANIGRNAFYHCNFTSIKIPSGMEFIGTDAFNGCRSLLHVTIPNSVSSINNYAFYNCDSLESVTIPISVMSIRNGAFEGCASLKDVYYDGSRADWGNIAIYTPNDEIKAATIHCNNGEYKLKEKLSAVTSEELTGWIYDDFDGDGELEAYALTHESGNAIVWYVSYSTGAIQIMNAGNAGWSNDTPLMCEKHKYLVMQQFEGGGTWYWARFYLFGVRNGLPYQPTISGNNGFFGSTEQDEYDFLSELMEEYSEPSQSGFYSCTWRGYGVVDQFPYENLQYYRYDSATMEFVEIGTNDSCPNGHTWDSFVGIIQPACTEPGSKTRTCTVCGATETETIAPLGHNYVNGACSRCGEPVSSYELRVYTSDCSFSIEEGTDMVFDVRLYKNNNAVQSWRAPSVVVSNNRQVATATVGGFHDFAYSMRVSALHQGETNLLISDPSSGAYITIPITVYKGPDGVRSFWMKDVPKFYPSVLGDRKIETNFYDLDGIYVRNYTYTKESDGYHVSFDAYNMSFSHGAVDVYNAKGEWIDCEQIKKYSDVSGIYDSVEYLYHFLISFGKDGPLAYTSGAMSEYSKMSFTVPEGGYFTISNDISCSLGSYLYNIADFMILGTESAISLASGIDLDSTAEHFAKSLEARLKQNETIKEIIVDQMQSVVLDSFKNGINKSKAATSMKDLCVSFVNATKDSWNLSNLLSTHLNVAEATIEKFGGPAGWMLEGLTSEVESFNYMMQVGEIANHLYHPAVYIHAPRTTESATIRGVSVQRNGAIPDDAVLQVYRLYDLSSSQWSSLKKDGLSGYDCEILNICFVKGDTTVSPTGKVAVKISVPPAVNGAYYLYREEPDGNWTRLQTVYENGTLLFETDHFSNYAILFDSVFSPCYDGVSCPGKKFTDIPAKDNWAHDAIDWAIVKEITSGTTKTTFSPNDGCTRGQVVTFLWRAAGQPKSTSNKNPFTDLKKGAFYYDAVLWAVEQGITSGMSKTTFAPNDICTRGQIVTFLWRFAGKPKAANRNNPFTDIAAKDFFFEPVLWAADSGVTTGTSKSQFSPKDTCTRAQVVTFLYRANDYSERMDQFASNNYEVVLDNLTWEEAQAAAVRKGGKLVTFESMDEYRFVVNLIQSEGDPNGYYHMGIRREANGTTYHRVDKDNRLYGEPLNSTDYWHNALWQEGEPNLVWNGYNETVAILFYYYGENRWCMYDARSYRITSGRQYGYIVEYD